MELYNELPVGCDWDFSCLHNLSFSAQRLHHIDIRRSGEKWTSRQPAEHCWRDQRERDHTEPLLCGQTDSVTIFSYYIIIGQILYGQICLYVYIGTTTSTWDCLSEGVLILNCPVCIRGGKREPQVWAQHMVVYYILYIIQLGPGTQLRTAPHYKQTI